MATKQYQAPQAVEYGHVRDMVQMSFLLSFVQKPV